MPHLAVRLALSLTALTVVAPAANAEVAANPRLVAFNEQFTQPKLMEVAPGVHAAFAYSYSTFSFIEGKTGIIVIDTGWFENSMQAALRDLRKITNKPVVAIIITHNHEDHVGGGGAALDEARGPIPIYGPSGFEQQTAYDAGSMRQLIQIRNYAQTGLALPAAGYKMVGTSVGPIPTPSPRREIKPTTLIDGRTDITIDGVRLTLIRNSTDLLENLMVWMPDIGVLFAGDPVGGVFPYAETPRYEPRRNPRDFVEALNTALALKPNVVIPGHGRVIVGPADVEHVLSVNRDVISFVTDQTERMLINGKSVEQVLHDLRIPKSLKDDPDIQPFYHKIDWIVRGLAVKRVGFYSDLLDLIRLDGIDEAARTIALAGGKDRVLAAARKALSNGDPRWAARLAQYVRLVDEDNPAAKTVMISALEKIAATTESVNEYNYALTAVGEEKKLINMAEFLSSRMTENAAAIATSTLLGMFRTRVKAEVVPEEETLTWKIEIEGEEVPNYLHLQRSVLSQPAQAEKIDATVKMDRSTLNQLYARTLSWRAALDSGKILISGSESAAAKLGTYIE